MVAIDNHKVKVSMLIDKGAGIELVGVAVELSESRAVGSLQLAADFGLVLMTIVVAFAEDSAKRSNMGNGHKLEVWEKGEAKVRSVASKCTNFEQFLRLAMLKSRSKCFQILNMHHAF